MEPTSHVYMTCPLRKIIVELLLTIQSVDNVGYTFKVLRTLYLLLVLPYSRVVEIKGFFVF